MKTIVEYIQKKHITNVSLNKNEIERQFKDLIDKYSRTKLEEFCQFRYFGYTQCRPENIKKRNNHSIFDVHTIDQLCSAIERPDLYINIFNYTYFIRNILSNNNSASKDENIIKEVAKQLHNKDFITCAVNMYGGIMESDEPLVIYKSIDELDVILKIIEKEL